MSDARGITDSDLNPAIARAARERSRA